MIRPWSALLVGPLVILAPCLRAAQNGGAGRIAYCDLHDANDVMVRVGNWCVDKYEDVVCDSSKTGEDFDKNCISDDNQNNGHIESANEDGSLLPDVIDRDGKIINRDYRAYSKPGLFPTRYVNLYQAMAACANAGKQLLSDPVWAMAALGTSDPGSNDGTEPGNTKCNTSNNKIPGNRRTGAAGGVLGGKDACVSQWGVEDLLGNLYEWTAIPTVFSNPTSQVAYSVRLGWVPNSVGATDKNHPSTGFRCMMPSFTAMRSR